MHGPSNIVKRLDLAIKACLFLLAFSAPLSIAATQTAWALALLFWIIRAFFHRPALRKDSFDLALLAFVGLTIVSSVFSYEPELSLRKLVPVSLVTIVYLVAGQAKNLRFRRRAIVVLLIGGAVSLAWTLGVLAVGKNLKVTRLAADGALRVAGVEENDTILKAGGVSVSSLADLGAAFDRHPVGDEIEIVLYRHELIIPVKLRASPDIGALGIIEWSRGRDTRASGFFGHFTTYAEAIQLILSLAFGLLVAAPGPFFSWNRLLLVVAVAAYSVALFLTITRASWAGFAISAAVIVFAGTTRKTFLIVAALAIPLAAGSLFYLQQKRNVGFIDTSDGSTTWRMTVWREGVGLLTSDPRHLAVGVGLESIKNRWKEWHLFDDGKLPTGHMHSTPLQIALERGVPAFLAWIAWMFLYLRLLWRALRRGDLAWPERGLVLGCLGGTIGFLAGGVVHYNWGDSEVVMIFYLLMGSSLAVLRSADELK